MGRLAESVQSAKKGGAALTSGGLVGRLSQPASQRQNTGRTSGGLVARVTRRAKKKTVLSEAVGVGSDRQRNKLGKS